MSLYNPWGVFMTSTTLARSTTHRPAAQGTAAGTTTDDDADRPVVVTHRHRTAKVLGNVLIGAIADTGTSAWTLEHRSHRPLTATEAQPAAEAWCAYNFPPPHDHRDASPNLNTYACRLGFLDGAANPDSSGTPEEQRVLAAEGQVGATNPQGMWDIAYLAGWSAGQDAARSA